MIILHSPPAKVATVDRFVSLYAIIIEDYSTKKHRGSQRKYIDTKGLNTYLHRCL